MKPDLCESNRLAAFLNDTLSDQEVTELMSHLDHCTACGKRLEQLAASEDRWKEAQSHLSQTALLQTSPRPDLDNENSVPFTVRQIRSMLDPTDDPNSMGRLGGYEIIGIVGSGAMGVVLKAVDKTLDRIVALKVMNLE